MKRVFVALLPIITVILFSCHTPRYIYSASPPNNPYFREQGESKLAAYHSTSGDENDSEHEYISGLDVQAAHALTNNWALTADHFRRREKQVGHDEDNSFFQTSTIRYRRNITSFGVGYFVPLMRNKAIMFNAFTGVGFGNFSFDDYGLNNGADYARNYKSNLMKFYIQPSFNFFPGRRFKTGLTTRFSWVHYGSIETSYTQPELEYLDLNLIGGKTLTFAEFSWNMQIALEKRGGIHLDFTFGVCSDPFANTTNLEARTLNTSIGLSVDLSKFKKRK